MSLTGPADPATEVMAAIEDGRLRRVGRANRGTSHVEREL